MLKTLRTKLFLGLAPLLAILFGLGLWAVAVVDHLGGRIDVILRENYASVLAAEGMKEALERLDSAAVAAANGQDEAARGLFAAHKAAFDRELARERRNLTIPGERELTEKLAGLYTRYLDLSGRYYALPAGRWDFYSKELQPLFGAIKDAADEVLRINQRNMEREDRLAREAARRSKRVTLAAVLASVVAASAIAVALSRSLLGPIRAVTDAARGLARGNYDQVVPVTTGDELGELAAAFNGMARTLRDYRAAGTARLVRAQQTTQATIDSFPDPVVVVDLDGAIERANPAARRILDAAPSAAGLPWAAPEPIRGPLAEALLGRDVEPPAGTQHAMMLRVDGQERFYQPRALPIRGDAGPLGAAVILQDVTKFRLVDQLKSDMVATVSHELKTPLTSVQMAVHLLLEEVVGPLEAKQVELLMAARQDADRLLAMVDDLLDLTRIEQGSMRLDLQPVAPAELVRDAIERSRTRADDRGVALTARVAPGLPQTQVDAERIAHVFDNLVGNALNHTDRGGAVTLAAEARDGAVEFAVADTGSGIPAQHLPRVFDRFYRVPGGRPGGAGLGLAIAREVVVGHGGQIEARSEPGQATTFTFRLPIARAGEGGTPVQPSGATS